MSFTVLDSLSVDTEYFFPYFINMLWCTEQVPRKMINQPQMLVELSLKKTKPRSPACLFLSSSMLPHTASSWSHILEPVWNYFQPQLQPKCTAFPIFLLTPLQRHHCSETHSSGKGDSFLSHLAIRFVWPWNPIEDLYSKVSWLFNFYLLFNISFYY